MTPFKNDTAELKLKLNTAQNSSILVQGVFKVDYRILP